MQAHFLIGPAGSGKTFRCLHEIRQELAGDPHGPPLLLLAPKQATFQLERQLLSSPELRGYTRLHILSFDRLAQFVCDRLGLVPQSLLSDEGRVMVLRALLSRNQNALKIFRASARLPGFAQELSLLLREMQNHGFTSDRLDELMRHVRSTGRLDEKLHDLRLMLESYRQWLREHHLQDVEALLDIAVEALQSTRQRRRLPTSLQFGGVWLDGFAQMTPQERRLLLALLPSSPRATLAFCLEGQPADDISWYSPWSVIAETFARCHAEVGALFGGEPGITLLGRDPHRNRFAGNPELQHLEGAWSNPRPYPGPPSAPASVRIVTCANPEMEAVFAAREILQFVRSGGRYRDVAVLVRQLDAYHHALRRVFTRYQIPFFLDRRESVAHHPLADLTRHALRTVALGWKQVDFFAALKTGLFPVDDSEIDLLENAALARGWDAAVWGKQLQLDEDPQLAARLESVRKLVVPPFERLTQTLQHHCSGAQLADGLRAFWSELQVEDTLESWVNRDVEAAEAPLLPTMHATVWDQMNAWLDSIALAFPDHVLPLGEWLPIIEAGLGGLTVGVIPPVLDQVLIGAIDRSRNPDLQCVFVLGINETVFPAPPPLPHLLTASDREELEAAGYALGTDQRRQIGHERFYGYIACTRARQRVILTYAVRDAAGKVLNPSIFVSHLQRLFPALPVETFVVDEAWDHAQHACELVAPLLEHCKVPDADNAALATLRKLPVFSAVLQRWQHLQAHSEPLHLSPAIAEKLYGRTLMTSISQLEKFAGCPFRFFVSAGLRARERTKFELDPRQQGTFQHEVLAKFHDELRAEGKRWRDLRPDEAQTRIAGAAATLIRTFEGGMMEKSAKNKFLATAYIHSLQQFIGTITAWLAQNEFDPSAVEVGFGEGEPLPAWELDLGEGHRLAFRGRIDRIDLWRDGEKDEAYCVVIDYKSNLRKFDELLLESGVQYQLPAYLNVLRRLPNPKPQFGVARLVPAGVFYVNLQGSYAAGETRRAVLQNEKTARQAAYRHEGRFDASLLRLFDKRPDAVAGDQFHYKKKNDGGFHKSLPAAMSSAAFAAMLDAVEGLMQEAGKRIYAGEVTIDPYRRGQQTACTYCDYSAICRIDPWVHTFRALSAQAAPANDSIP